VMLLDLVADAMRCSEADAEREQSDRDTEQHACGSREDHSDRGTDEDQRERDEGQP
jgi:hypothetical protein